MIKNKKILFAAIIVLFAFLNGVYDLFQIRFVAGDIYPAYSSLRTDPLGAKILYESLEKCCNLKVERNYRPLSKLRDRPDAVLFLLGVELFEVKKLPSNLVDDLEYFLINGGRLVIPFLDSGIVSNEPIWFTQEPSKEDEDKKGKKKKEGKQKRTENDIGPFELSSLAKEWGFEFSNAPLLKEATNATLSKSAQSETLPVRITCRSPAYFISLDQNWRVLYEREGRPVIIERKFGKGSIALSTTSYFLSNEAMFRERNPELMVWTIGQKSVVIFDEYHLGIQSTPGIAALLRKYGLHWMVAGFLVLAGLFIWKNSSGLVPPIKDVPKEQEVFSKGKDSAAGLINLLRRNINIQNIFLACYEEWLKSLGPQKKDLSKKLERIQELVDHEINNVSKPQNALKTYNSISLILRERE